jgi:hypothetical protein
MWFLFIVSGGKPGDGLHFLYAQVTQAAPSGRRVAVTVGRGWAKAVPIPETVPHSAPFVQPAEFAQRPVFSFCGIRPRESLRFALRKIKPNVVSQLISR